MMSVYKPAYMVLEQVDLLSIVEPRCLGRDSREGRVDRDEESASVAILNCIVEVERRGEFEEFRGSIHRCEG